jgi:hypothetical protein
MEFAVVESKKSPEHLCELLTEFASSHDVKTITGMFWQPRGAIVVVGYEPMVWSASSSNADWPEEDWPDEPEGYGPE